MADLLPLNPDELLTTTRAVRKRLDLTRPVDRSVVEECIEIAMQAPSGSNRQTWQWVLVDDPAKKKALADLYGERLRLLLVVARQRQLRRGRHRGPQRKDAVSASAKHLRDHYHEVPVLLLAVPGGPSDQLPAGAQPGCWGSVDPRGVELHAGAAGPRASGSAWTTMTCRREAEVAEVLGVDHEQYTQVGMFPVAYTHRHRLQAGAAGRPRRRSSTGTSGDRLTAVSLHLLSTRRW